MQETDHNHLTSAPPGDLERRFTNLPALRYSIDEVSPKVIYPGWRSHTVIHSVRDLIATTGDSVWALTAGGVLRLTWKGETTQLERFGSEHGIPGSGFQCLLLDLFGRPWLYGGCKGVVFYDGSNWLPFHIADVLSPPKVLCGICDHSGRLLLVTDKGMGWVVFDQFERPSWQPYDMTSACLPGMNIYAVASGLDGQLAFGTPWGLYLKPQETAEWQRFTQTDGLSSRLVHSLLYQPDGKLWIGTQTGLDLYHGGRFTSIPEIQTGVFKIASAHIPDCYWFITTGRIFQHRNGFCEFLSPPPFPQCRAVSVAITVTGRIVAGFSEGVAEYAPQARVVVPPDRDLPQNETITALTVDVSGHVWAGSATGVRVYHRNSWRAYRKPEKTLDPIRNISQIATATDGSVWVGSWESGTWGGIRHSVHPFSLRRINSPAVPPNVDALCCDQEGVFIGSGKTIYCYKNKQWSILTQSPNETALIRCLLAARDNLWCGTTAGLYRFTNEAWQQVSDLPVDCLAADNSILKWVGSRQGLYSYEDSALTLFTLRQVPINALLLSETRLWIGTTQGLACYQSEGELRMWDSGNSGLPHNQIFALAYDDKSETLWIGTGNGVAQYQLSNLE